MNQQTAKEYLAKFNEINLNNPGSGKEVNSRRNNERDKLARKVCPLVGLGNMFTHHPKTKRIVSMEQVLLKLKEVAESDR